MKTKQIIIAAIFSIFSVSQVCAVGSSDSMKDKNESWLQNRNESLIKSGDPGPSLTPSVSESPIQDALPFLLGLGIVYGAYVFGRKRESVN